MGLRMGPRMMEMSKYRSKDKGWAKGQRPGLMRGPEIKDGSKSRSKDEGQL